MSVLFSTWHHIRAEMSMLFSTWRHTRAEVSVLFSTWRHTRAEMSVFIPNLASHTSLDVCVPVCILDTSSSKDSYELHMFVQTYKPDRCLCLVRTNNKCNGSILWSVSRTGDQRDNN